LKFFNYNTLQPASYRAIMKILEAQSAMLTNYDVYKHLAEQKARHAKIPIRIGARPGNLQTVTKEVLQPLPLLSIRILLTCSQLLDYFEEAPSPLNTAKHTKPIPYNDETVKVLLEKLRKFDLTKAEILMIMNLRPTKPESLNTIVEEFETRFESEEQQQEMVDLIAEALGRPDGAAERQAMVDNAEDARKVDQEVQYARMQEELKMEVDD
jgi:hypothetical protein